MIDLRSRMEELSATAGAEEDSDPPVRNAAETEVSPQGSEEGVRTAKVEQVQTSLRAGSYRVPADAVAATIVSAMLARRR